MFPRTGNKQALPLSLRRRVWGTADPLTLTSVPGKVVEQTVLATIPNHPKDREKTGSSQHGFMKGRNQAWPTWYPFMMRRLVQFGTLLVCRSLVRSLPSTSSYGCWSLRLQAVELLPTFREGRPRSWLKLQDKDYTDSLCAHWQLLDAKMGESSSPRCDRRNPSKADRPPALILLLVRAVRWWVGNVECKGVSA